MKRTLYLHIGAHRTATTSIQKFMFQNFEQLLRVGIFYPFRIPRHARFINEIFSRKHSARSATKALNERIGNWEHQLNRPVTTLVLSDEDICRRTNLKRLADFRKYFDVKVLYSVRRQDLWLESWYFQNIKWQWNKTLANCTFETFMEHRDEFHWINYDSYLRMVEAEFGRENVLLTVFEKQQMPNGVIGTFADHIGLKDPASFEQPTHENYSLSAEMAEFLRHLPLHEVPEPERDILRRTFEQVDRNAFGNTRYQSERIMPLAQRESVLADYAVENAAVAQRYFGRDALFMDPLPPADGPLANLNIPRDSNEVIEKFVVPLLKQLLANGTISSANKKT
ncbi:hypothetical protein [Cognatishimia sp.]|uniref:hypothetical protein n=1 Tax=Cognatishimia sp. TaxID=2211648 RepID=UPI0035165539